MFGSLRQPDLRRRDVREQRHRDAVVLPAERLAEDAQEPHRPLPAIAGDVRHAHRRRAVLQDDEVDAGRPDQRDGARRPRQRQDREGGRDRSGTARTADPPKIGNRSRTGSRRCCRNRRVSRRRARQLPAPDDQQHRRHDQQPQVQRLRESHRIQVDAGSGILQLGFSPSQPPSSPSPFRIFVPPLPASGARCVPRRASG